MYVPTTINREIDSNFRVTSQTTLLDSTSTSIRTRFDEYIDSLNEKTKVRIIGSRQKTDLRQMSHMTMSTNCLH